MLGIKNKLIKKAIGCTSILKQAQLKKDNSLLKSNMNGGLMRVRITNKCPGKCKYCGLLSWSEEERNQSMDPKWLYDYLRPLYKDVDEILITGGDPFVATESYDYMRFLSINYPQVTIITESNGLAFGKRFQELAAENLFRTHFSLNASNEDVFCQGCWPGEEGRYAYRKITRNIIDYNDLLNKKGLMDFAPDYSMVINKDTADDVANFVAQVLMLGCTSINMYFDYTESSMSDDYFGEPDTSRRALRTLLELEKLLKNKLYLGFRLWVPLKELELAEKNGYDCDINVLKKKYAVIHELSQGRSIIKEFKHRNQIRQERGKKQLSLEEDYSPTLRMIDIGDRKVCFAPWKEIDIYPSGRIDFCGWFTETQNINDYICNEKVDWNSLLNSSKYRKGRKDVLDGKYSGCMECCPLNAKNKEIQQIYRYILNDDTGQDNTF